MAELEDGFINGSYCRHCARYIGEPVGYPRLCGSCKEYETEKDKQAQNYKKPNNESTQESKHKKRPLR